MLSQRFTNVLFGRRFFSFSSLVPRVAISPYLGTSPLVSGTRPNEISAISIPIFKSYVEQQVEKPLVLCVNTWTRKKFHMKKHIKQKKKARLRRLAAVPYNSVLEIIKKKKRTWKRHWQTRLIVKRRGRDEPGCGRRCRLMKQR